MFKSVDNNRRLAIISLMLMVIGIWFRCTALDSKFYWHDEVYTSFFLSGYKPYIVNDALATGQPLALQQIQFYQQMHEDKTVLDTVISLLAFDPHHPPLYYVALWSWSKIFGASVVSVRAFSALCGILLLPAWFWLCRELFSSRRAAFIGLSLMAVSPFQVLYSQEARPYSIWALATCVSCAALLRARRITESSAITSHRVWWIYTGTILLGLYTHLLFVFVVAAHALWMRFSTCGVNQELQEEQKSGSQLTEAGYLRFSRHSFLRSIAVAFVVYLPFLLLLFRRRQASRAHLDWTSNSTTLAQRWSEWATNLSAPFFDPHPLPAEMIVPRVLAAVGVVAALAYSVHCAVSQTRSPSQKALKSAGRSVGVFVLALFLCSVLPLLLPDLMSGGRRSQVARFFIPAILSLQLAVTYALFQFSQARLQWRRLGILCATLLIMAGFWSCETSRRSTHWWNKGKSFDGGRIAFVINRFPQPLLISSTRQVHLGNGVALSRYLRPDARLLFENDADKLILPRHFKEVYVLSPDDSMKSKLHKRYNLVPRSTSVDGLWQFVPTSTGS